MVHARIGIYTAQPGTIEPILAKGQEELVPLTQRQPGLRRYYGIRTGPDSAASITTWDTEEQAQAAAERLAGWVRQELGTALSAVENRVGEVVINHFTGAPLEGHARLSLWRFNSDHIDRLIEAGRAEYVPALAAQPGFVGYGIARTEADTTAIVTVFADAAQLQSALAATGAIVERVVAGHGEATARYEGPIIWSVTGEGQ